MKNETISIFEDYVNDFPSYQEHLHSLYTLRDIVKKKNFSLQADGSFQVKHYVGFFQHGNFRLQILPKVFSKTSFTDKSETEVQASLDFVYRLLYWSGYLNIKRLQPQHNSSSHSDLLELFISIFIDEFILLFKRKIYRRYEQQEENLQFIKGKILFAETIRRNPILKHKHVVRYDEYTIDNLLNRIFKALILKLLYITKDRGNKNKLVVGLTYLEEVGLITLSKGTFDKIKFDRLNNDFEPLFNLAKLFYHNHQPGMSSGAESTFNFLIPLNLLFENFIAKVLKSFSTKEIKYQYHKPQKFLGHDGTADVFNLEPDFTVFEGKKCLCILDAKYKYPFDGSGNIVINTADLYQLTTYAARYNTKSLILIHPKFKGAPIDQELLKDYKLKTAFGDVNLRVVQIDILNKELDEITRELAKVVQLIS